MASRTKSAHPWVQPIIVAKHGTHEDTVRLGALASLAVYLNDDGPARLADPELAAVNPWALWLAGPFTKTVRRAFAADITRVVIWCQENGVTFEYAAFDGGSAALALTPMLADALPKPVARLQVSGTDLPRAPSASEPTPPAWVTLHVDETLTTGKATAQAAHALWMWALAELTPGPQALDAFGRLDLPMDLRLVSQEHLRALAAQPGAHAVHDAGLTEVAAGTLTAVAQPTHHENTEAP